MGLKECGLNLSRDNKELKPHGTIDFPCAGYSSSYRDSEDDIILLFQCHGDGAMFPVVGDGILQEIGKQPDHQRLIGMHVNIGLNVSMQGDMALCGDLFVFFREHFSQFAEIEVFFL